ncbi:MAG: hypothetical protein IJ785_00360 [Bacteroidales bacterium]|nr:hypothetical protein [Bacteroidales bacterium]
MTITSDNYEQWFYRYSEGELDAEQRAAVEAFAAQHPDLAEELALYDPSLKLQPSAPTVYTDKESLLHRQPTVVPLWRWAAAACAVGVMLAGVWFFTPSGEPDSPLVAETHIQQPLPHQGGEPLPTTGSASAADQASHTPILTPKRPPLPAQAAALHRCPNPVGAPGSKPSQPIADSPSIPTEPPLPMPETPSVEALAEAEPVVIIHHEIYVVANAEPEIVQEGTFTDEPEEGLESLRAFGRGLTARIRAGVLRAEGNARVALASL